MLYLFFLTFFLRLLLMHWILSYCRVSFLMLFLHHVCSYIVLCILRELFLISILIFFIQETHIICGILLHDVFLVSLSIGPSNEYSGLISFRMVWLDLHCSPRDSQESCPTPQYKSISSLVLSFLYGPTLTSSHYFWKNHGFQCTDFCW